MKKLLLILILFNFSINVSAQERIEVQLEKCVDGDTAWFIYNKKSCKFRFLAIDTPESTNQIEPYGKEASEYTCEELKNAKKIEVQFDEQSDKKDKYDRYLAWIFVDNQLLQKKIVEKGYAEIKYIYGNYLYVDGLRKVEQISKKKKIGIFSKNYSSIEKNDIVIYTIAIIIIIILCIFNQKFRKKMIKKIKKATKSNIQKISNKKSTS